MTPSLCCPDISAPIHYVRSLRARRLRITIKPDPAVVVTVPRRGSMEEAQQFLASKQAWIKKHLDQMARQNREMPSIDLQKVDLKKAQDELFNRLDEFSAQHNLLYRRASFRCQKTKGGSCSSQNTISLNINIVFLPKHLQDYILLHELVHIRHKNHSPKFWAELDQHCGGRAKAMRNELKSHTLQIKR